MSFLFTSLTSYSSSPTRTHLRMLAYHELQRQPKSFFQLIESLFIPLPTSPYFYKVSADSAVDAYEIHGRGILEDREKMERGFLLEVRS